MMLTRCPACRTTFRIRPEQAKARHGKVRCGRCQHVFDAIEFLVEGAPVAPPIAVTKPIATAAPVPSLPPQLHTPGDDLDDFSVLAEVDTPTAPPDAEIIAIVAEKKSNKKTKPARKEPSPISNAYLRDVEKARVTRWPWMLGAVLASVALLGQAAIAWRVDLATRYPQLREPLSELCAAFDCVVGLPANPALLKIESSDLHPSTQKKGQLELVGLLKNHAPYTQSWPHLELALTDGADRTIVRKVLAPESYVTNPITLSGGFPADGEFAVQLQLEVGDLPAAGYRLYLFYP